MKIWIFVAALVALGTSARAQSIPLHGAPQGVTSCTIPTSVTPHTIGTGLCPFISFQTHWKPGDGSPVADPPDTLVHNLAHSHIECNLPHLGEINAPFTVPCQFQAFHLAGKIALSYSGGLVTSFTVDDPTHWPVIGDPAGVVVVPFHLTIDPTKFVETDKVQAHGWANIWFGVRTYVDNGDTYDTQIFFTIWSTQDLTAAPLPEGEGTRIMLAARSTAVSARDTSIGSWGSHLMEVRDIAMPLFAPFSKPITFDTLSYTYSGEDFAFETEYHLICDNDYHHGLAGVEQTFITATIPVSGEQFNHDFLDPLKISQSTQPSGFPPGVHRCTLTWTESTPDGVAVPSERGGLIAAGETLISLISWDTAIGPSPIGCTPETCNLTTPPPPPPPPPVIIPKPSPPPSSTPPPLSLPPLSLPRIPPT